MTYSMRDALTEAMHESNEPLVRGKIRYALWVLDEAEWELDGWQQDFVPNRLIPDPDKFDLGGPHAP